MSLKDVFVTPEHKTQAVALKAQANEAFTSNISSEPVYVNTKAKFYIDHNFPNATRLYSEAIDLDPTDKTYWCNRAVARMKLEEYGYAVNDASEHPCNHH